MYSFNYDHRIDTAMVVKFLINTTDFKHFKAFKNREEINEIE